MEKYDKNMDCQIDFFEFIPMYGELVAMQDAMNWAGTHGYMPPEQYNEVAMTPSSDLWSVGATLFKLTSGQLPFSVTNSRPEERRVRHVAVLCSGSRLPGLSCYVVVISAQVVDKALQKQVDKRYSSASDMRDELAAILYDLGPSLARPYLMPDTTFTGGSRCCVTRALASSTLMQVSQVPWRRMGRQWRHDGIKKHNSRHAASAEWGINNCLGDELHLAKRTRQRRKLDGPDLTYFQCSNRNEREYKHDATYRSIAVGEQVVQVYRRRRRRRCALSFSPPAMISRSNVAGAATPASMTVSNQQRFYSIWRGQARPAPVTRGPN
eukprot:768745-Hanusia_phi.AAC.6